MLNHSDPLNINHVLDTVLRAEGYDVRHTILTIPKELTVYVKIDKTAGEQTPQRQAEYYGMVRTSI